ncbi:uncharacterized protein LOC136096075 [Hydra vulgaris]|uniref:uncharacterized protein LOC136096075 n=1 Tax=Hydra vulgaris TaxID=6087 RepID=UPI0032EA459B
MYSIAKSNAIPDYNYLEEMYQICQHCGAKKFSDETHFLCCHNGKVALPPLSPITQALQDLFTGSYVDRNTKANLIKRIRNYNACLSFASFTANLVQPMNHGPPCIKICGKIFHCVVYSAWWKYIAGRAVFYILYVLYGEICAICGKVD